MLGRTRTVHRSRPSGSISTPSRLFHRATTTTTMTTIKTTQNTPLRLSNRDTPLFTPINTRTLPITRHNQNQYRWQSNQQQKEQYERFQEEFGKEPLFMQKVKKESRKATILIALMMLFPLVILPYYYVSSDEDRLENGLEQLKEYEAYRKQKAEQKRNASPGNESESNTTVTSVNTDDDTEELSTAKHFKYILVGGGTAAYCALKAIRERDPEAEVLIIGEEPVPPYRRPPLSKELWRSENPRAAERLVYEGYNGKEQSLFYQEEEWYATDDKVIFLSGTPVHDLNVSRKEVSLADGRSFSYTRCLVATGGTPMQIPGCTPDIADRVTTFRTVADFKKLDRMTQKEGGKIAVVGGSFLGTELTAAIADRKGRNADVVQIFPEPGVMARNLPRYLSEFITDTLKQRGVNILSDTLVENVSKNNDDGRVKIHLDNGDEIVVDQVVLAIGIAPNTELAEKAGLEIDPRHGGIVANAELEARRGVYVAGDVASYHDTVLGRRRVEHHDHSVSSGRRAGLNMTGNPRPYTHLPMFWSDVGEIGYQAVGNIDSSLDTVSFWDRVNVSQGGSLWSFAAAPVKVGGYNKGVVYYMRDKRVVGVLLWNLDNKVDEARQLIKSKHCFNDPNIELRNRINFD